MRTLQCIFLGSLFCALSVTSIARAQGDSAWQKEIGTWREDHAATLQKPDGWLSLTGLDWLSEGDNSVGSAMDNKIHLADGNPAHLCVLRLTKDAVALLAPSGGFPAGFMVGGETPKDGPLHADPEQDKNNPRLTVGTLNMYVIRRADRFALRIKDSHAPALVGFHGLKWYAPNAAYRVTAKWTPYNPPKTITLATLVGTNYSQPVPGNAEFVLEGKTFRLEPVVEDPNDGKLFFIMRDTTSSTTTYAAARFLYTGYPDQGLTQPGELVLDFNKLENPPCAYTPYSTCPLPPQTNRLPIALPVGEQRYHE